MIYEDGMIIAWSGSLAAVPAGWDLCDGGGGRPDLRNRFLVGAGGDYTAGETGGAAEVALTEAQIPAHGHPGSATSVEHHNHQYERRRLDRSAGAYHERYRRSLSPHWDTSNVTHGHDNPTIHNAGGDQAHENRPPYMALAWLVRTGGASPMLPPGAILFWSGTEAEDLPLGWALCDGEGGTPDLQDRFIVGAGDSYGMEDEGGEAQVALAEGELPEHDHTGSIPDNTHSHTYRQYVRGARDLESDSGNRDPGSSSTTRDTTQDGAHDHEVNVASQGGGQGHENRPPYYALAMIMWTGEV